MGSPERSWLRWCRLCGKDTYPGPPINVLQIDWQTESAGEDECFPQKVENLLSSIEKFFGIKITANDHLPIFICATCFALVTSLMDYSRHVMKMQKMLFAVFMAKKRNKDYNENLIRTLFNSNTMDAGKIKFPMDSTVKGSNGFESVFSEAYITIEKQHCSNVDPLLAKAEIKEEPVWEQPMENVMKSAQEQKGNEIAIAGDGDTTELPEEEERNSPSELLWSSDKSDSGSDHEEIMSNKQQKESDAEQTYPCHECPLKFAMLREYTTHMRLEHEGCKARIICIKCNRECTSAPSFKSHWNSHYAAFKTVPCELCHKKFLTQKHMLRHKKHWHFKERTCVCEVCGYPTRRLSELKQHMKVHNKRNENVQCPECDKKFKSKITMERHRGSHFIEKSHMCPLCGELKHTADLLARHMKVHINERPYKCEICSASFKCSKNLKAHQFTHKDTKEFQCDICNKYMKSPISLHSHKKRHRLEGKGKK